MFLFFRFIQIIDIHLKLPDLILSIFRLDVSFNFLFQSELFNLKYFIYIPLNQLLS